MTDLNTIIQRRQDALAATPDDHPDRARRLHILAVGYYIKYRKTRESTDLEPAIQQLQNALEANPNHPHQASLLEKLSDLYHDKYYETGALIDLETAIQQLRDAVKATPNDDPYRASRLHDLGIGYRDKYQRTGVLTDVETAIQYFQNALEAAHDDEPNRSGLSHSLGHGYHDRYRLTGTFTDLETAIQYFQDAVDATPNDHPDRARYLNSLGRGYGERYETTRASIDLETAIQRLQSALEATPDDHSDRAVRLYNLSVAYSLRSNRTRTLTDQEIALHYLQDALQCLQDALNATPIDYQQRPTLLRNLGNGYSEKYQRTRNLMDQEIAIQYFQDALKVIPKDHIFQAGLLFSLDTEYEDKYQRNKAWIDLETAVQRYQDALNCTPNDHPDRIGQLYSLGVGYHHRYQQTKALKDLEPVIRYFQEAIECTIADPIERLRPAIQLVRLLATSERWLQAYLVASTGFTLIPLIVPRFLENADKQHIITEIVGFASDGAAVTLMAGKPIYEAVQFLELGRGIISRTSGELWTDISDLQQNHPRVAMEYTYLREMLSRPVAFTHQMQQDDFVTKLRRHGRHSTGRQIEGLIEDIRKLPGFERFLLAPSEAELKASAAQGPVIVINVSDYRCDALIIEKDEIRVLPLPRLHPIDIRDRVENLDSETVDTQLLNWLWETIVKPVLEELGFCETPADIWPRIWWIPIGPLARFPIHAAGCHSHDSDNNVLDRAISSYSSSIRSLIWSRRDALKFPKLRKPKNLLLVCMPELLHARREIDEIKTLHSATNSKLNEPGSLREDVLAALDDCEIFHFAGHGRTDARDPSESALILSDGELTVSRLFETNLRDRQQFLAYLSACGTGRVKNDTLVDESLHLIAAFQLAGFQHVIGTLWRVDDRICVDVAKATYGWMQKMDMNDESVSEGLHHACRSLRKQWIQENAFRAAAKRDLVAQLDHDLREQSRSSQSKPRDARDITTCEEVPLNWVPYVHFGV